jgi:hypothetical protein
MKACRVWARRYIKIGHVDPNTLQQFDHLPRSMFKASQASIDVKYQKSRICNPNVFNVNAYCLAVMYNSMEMCPANKLSPKVPQDSLAWTQHGSNMPQVGLR